VLGALGAAGTLGTSTWPRSGAGTVGVSSVGTGRLDVSGAGGGAGSGAGVVDVGTVSVGSGAVGVWAAGAETVGTDTAGAAGLEDGDAAPVGVMGCPAVPDGADDGSAPA
jgi:hypothetical protein